MRITFDEKKRLAVLADRGLDFRDATEIFEKFHLTRRDERDYSEERFQTVGELKGSVVLIVWTPRDESRRVITMWKLDHEGSERFYRRRDRGG